MKEINARPCLLGVGERRFMSDWLFCACIWHAEFYEVFLKRGVYFLYRSLFD